MVKRDFKNYLFFCLILFFSLIINSSSSKIKVLVDKAEIREEPDNSSSIIAKVPIETILDSSGKSGEWYKVSFKYRGKFTISGYIHQSLVKLIGFRKSKEMRKERKEKPSEIREQRSPKIEPKYIPKKTSQRKFAFSLSPSFNIISMSDWNKIIDTWNLDFSSTGYREMENIKEGLDLLFFEGRIFLFPKIALGLQFGSIAREGNTDYRGWELKVSGLSLALNGYYYFFVANKFIPYIGAGIGLIFSDIKFSDSYDQKANYYGTELGFNFIGGAEYFIFSSISISFEIGYRFTIPGTIKVKEGLSSMEEEGQILIYDPANPSGWDTIPEYDFEYYRNLYGSEKLTTDFSGLSCKFKISYYF